MSKLSSRSLLVLSALLIATLISATLAQPTIPLPSLGVRASAEVLTNGDFELDTDLDKLPDGWTGKNAELENRDRLKCDKPEQSKFFAHTGDCAFMFRGNSSGTPSKILFPITDLTPFVSGSQVVFSVYIDPRSGLVNSKFGQLTIRFTDNTRQKLILTIPSSTTARGSEDYVQVTQSLILPANEIEKVKLDFRYREQTGKFLIDDASLSIVTVDATATPTDTFTPTNTATASLTPTITATPLPIGKIVADDGTGGDSFGESVAIDGDTMVVGAIYKTVGGNSSQGAAYVFTRSGNVWTQQAKLTASDGLASNYFGSAIAIDGDTVVVGAYGYSVGGNSNQGAAYVFTRSGTVWTEQQKLTASDGLAFDDFGLAVDVSGDTVVVGSHGDDIGANSAQGSAYVFTRTGTVWTEQQKLTASDGAAFDDFGSSVTIDGETIIIGAESDDIGANSNQGSAYVFTRTGTVWTQQQKLTTSDGASTDHLGSSIAMDGNTVVIGADGDTVVANSQGSAYVFIFSAGVWTEQQRLTASDGELLDIFGGTVAISGDIVVIGADFNDIGGNGNQGAAYVFTRSGTVWTQQQQLLASDGAANDWFGRSVGVSGTTAMVGVPGGEFGATNNQGVVYAFNLIP